jgi:hypothetical protein
MATTTNFNWSTPDDTDLVKDGAAAIRTLGSSIDTSFVDLKGGTSGQFLAKNSGTDLDFVWANAPGKVLQVVQADSSTSTSVTSTTFTDTTLTASITPSSTNSKVLILVSQNTQIYRSLANAFGKIRIMRDSTSVFDMTGSNDRAFGWENTFNSYNEHLWTIAMNYLDSPASTSAITYKTQGAVNTAGPTVVFQNSSAKSTITLMEIGA